AEETFASPITRLINASGYACRNRNGSHSHSDRLSEHALANAVDIAAFVTADGRTIEVARHWGPTVRDQREATNTAAARGKDGKEGKEGAAKSEAKSPLRTPSAISRPGGERRTRDEEAAGKTTTAELRRLGRGVEVKRDASAAPPLAAA